MLNYCREVSKSSSSLLRLGVGLTLYAVIQVSVALTWGCMSAISTSCWKISECLKYVAVYPKININ